VAQSIPHSNSSIDDRWQFANKETFLHLLLFFLGSGQAGNNKVEYNASDMSSKVIVFPVDDSPIKCKKLERLNHILYNQ